MRSTFDLCLLLFSASACTPTGPTPAIGSVASPSSSSSPEPVNGTVAEPTSEPAEAGPGPGPLRIDRGGTITTPRPYVRDDEPSMSDEPSIVGWSAVTGEFLYCVPSGGAECESCEFVRPGGPAERIGVGPDCQRRISRAALDARIAAGGFTIADGDWAHGAGVVLTVESRQGEPDGTGMERGVLTIGARLIGGDAGHPGMTGSSAVIEEVTVCLEDEEFCAPDVHTDAIGASPDGRTIAVLVHSFAGEYTDTYEVKLLDADAVLGAARAAFEP